MVTSGLLATELVKGQVQVGDSVFQNRPPPAIPVAGDPNNVGPTYAQIGTSGLTAAASATIGQQTVRALSSMGAAGTFAMGANDANARVAAFDAATQHNVPATFNDYRNKAGLLTIGFAIAEPFWANGVLVGGQTKDVLVQAFERRVLTYTPTNPDAFKVEFGNIGAHYFLWRYGGGGAPTMSVGPMLPVSPAPTSTPSTGATATPARPVAPIASTGTVFIILMENHNDTSIVGNPNAPFINQLAAQGAVGDQYFGVRHPSLPNYLSLIGGDTFGVTDDCTTCFKDAPNLVDSLEAKGKSWKSYQEDLPQPCFLGETAGGDHGYAMKHNPFLYFNDIRTNPARCNRVVPIGQLDSDLASGQVPDFVWITPNLIHDMHDGTIQDGNQWLQSFVPKILQSNTYQQGGQLIIAWDEGEGSTPEGCCNGLAAGGHIPLLILAPNVMPGSHITMPSTHYNLLRMIEDRWGLTRVGHSADANVLPIVVPTSGAGKS